MTNWLTDTRQTIDADTWRRVVTGAGPRLALTYRDLLEAGDSIEATVLDCTGGWHTTQRWRGVRVDTLLARASGIREEARSVLVRSATGYTRRFAIGAQRGSSSRRTSRGSPSTRATALPCASSLLVSAGTTG